MSVGRSDWSTLSSLARQWTMEDEEEVERERRRRVKSSSSARDTESDVSAAPVDTPASDREADCPPETSPDSSSVEQMQLDFVGMLRVRDERCGMRRMESLRRQKGVGEEDEKSGGEGGRGGRRREELTAEQDKSTTKTNQPQQQENGEPLKKDAISRQPSDTTRKFVSSVSICLDKSPSASGRTTPVSPLSPRTPRSPREQWSSPCSSPSPHGLRSPIPNGHALETSVMSSSTDNNGEQTTKALLIRKSSRTISFRMMRKKEEETSPLQRSASVRVASKKFECKTVKNEALNEDKAPSFQRNSVQRVSSRSIQEKMDRLAQAAQKSETGRCPDVSQRTLYLLDEVSRKRGIFEKEPQADAPVGPPKHEFRGSTSGMSDRIDRWLDKTTPIGCTSNPTDFKSVDFTSKRSLFKNVTKSKQGQIYK
ncbi:ladinin-1 [Phyllopteryx taeniolatus]|uniref:ladinin-1 n=1 Tax=Phyllopteryx taeniolatus TaxID=161469 RepID=UPI002AD2E969|nr:ladinin-1 [Phyllopteryx taeniolatus]